jgi:hypothetical protein
MKWSDFETRIRPEMLGGKAFTLTVAAITIDEVLPRVGQPKEKIPVLHFAETTKTLVLNAGNRRNLSRMFGDDANQVVGHRVTLTPCTNNTSKGRQPGIQVTPASSKPAPGEVDTSTGEVAQGDAADLDTEAEEVQGEG